ncbi:hypothetical protein PACTADRAFT_47626 [Pachysolen tannophilus NRRL Y-2460]|uniref:Signal recognition particle 54 kDa protein n=1 Tax=Pachysolen tannophilus NRRL Y-2460 TaxID=669874 RepID=A0A1E4U1B0_PACTA|nr:hypothetical protein PACTADRAFT_47626 [Pachysolen tannophilus NRRL Y-2460]
MVLADLGRRINDAVNENIIKSGGSNVDSDSINLMLKEISNALLESDVNIKLVMKLRERIKKSIDVECEKNKSINKKKLIQKIVFDELCNLVDFETYEENNDNNNNNNDKKKITVFKPKKKQSNVIMFVGLQGSGKTTSCTKLAVYYQRRGFKVGLVCADTFRAGAFDQLKQNATKAKIPYYGSYTETDPVKVSFDGVEKFKKEKFEIIIVDTSGRHRQEEQLFEEMIQISNAVNPQQTIMVLDAAIGQAAESQAKAFKESANFGAIILTKMDGHAKGGGAISAVAATKTPIIFIGTGEHIQDLETFQPRNFISKLLGIGDIQGLMEHVKSLNLDQKDTMKNLSEGKFTLLDFQTQLNNMLKMGPLSKIASMLPGGLGQMLNQAGEEDTTLMIKRMIYIMDSMTKKELASDGRIFIQEPSRIVRVARGSGTSVGEVESVLMQQRAMEGMASNMAGMSRAGGTPPPGITGGPGGAGGLANMMNPANIQRAMANMRNNPMLKSMLGSMPGGEEEISKMMSDPNAMASMMQNPQVQQMMKNPSMMQNMMKQFGGGM